MTSLTEDSGTSSRATNRVIPCVRAYSKTRGPATGITLHPMAVVRMNKDSR